MHVTLIERFFYPDTAPGALLTRGLAAHLADAGHAVQVVAGQPSYTSATAVGRAPRAEVLDGVQVRRLPVVHEHGGRWRQLANMALFPLQVGYRLLRQPGDVVVCNTVPQVVLPAVVALAARLSGQSFVYQCMDLHPDIGRLSGEFANPLVYRVLRAVDTWSMRSAASVVVLSEDMRREVVARHPSLADSTVIINNFSPAAEETAESSLGPPPAGTTRAVFTGNLGRFQGLDTVAAAMEHLGPDDRVQLVFMGDGRFREQLEQQVADLRVPAASEVVFVPHGSPAQARALMRTAHVGIVSLRSDLVRFAYPSKTATYAEQGLPLLVVCESGTELEALVQQEGLGWHAAPGQPEGIAAALAAAAAEVRAGGWSDRSERVATYARRTFALDAVWPHWDRLFDCLPGRDPLRLRARVLKRTVDVVGASVGLVLTAPVIALATAVATVDTRSWGIYSQPRVGRYGRLFNVHKIRTMRRTADPSTVTTADDPRITRSGRVMRRLKIDELPQLWNVLKGEMSLVGPRPDVPGFADRLQGADRTLLHLRPGITGPASLAFRDEEELLAQQADPERFNRQVVWPRKVALNRSYHRGWSLRGDLREIVRTVWPSRADDAAGHRPGAGTGARA